MVETHGFVSQGFIKSTKHDYLVNSVPGSVEFNEVGINFTVSPEDALRIGVQLFARDLGKVGNYTPRVDWFYLDYRFRDWFGIRAGRTKVPFGLYNETSDIDAARRTILLPQSVYPIQNRDLLLAQTGGELYGTISLAGAGDLEYRAYGGTLFFDTSESQSTIQNLEVPYLFGGRLMWQLPIDGLQAGGSIQRLRLNGGFTPTAAQLQQLGGAPAGFSGTATFEIDATLALASLEYSTNDWLLATEYSRWTVETESNLEPLVPKPVTVSERAYVMASYRLNPWVAPSLYYSVLVPDRFPRASQPDQKQGAYQHDLAATVRFDLNPHWLLKIEGHYMNGTAALDPAINNNTPRSRLDAEWGVLLVKTTAYF